MTYFGNRKIGNFKPSVTERMKAKRVDTREDRDGNDNVHLAALRKCPCIVTGKQPAGEAHHLKQNTKDRGMGMRSSDKWAVPLSHIPHMELEGVGSRNETKWFQDRGVPAPLDLAADLYRVSPDVTKMRAVIKAHTGR